MAASWEREADLLDTGVGEIAHVGGTGEHPVGGVHKNGSRIELLLRNDPYLLKLFVCLTSVSGSGFSLRFPFLGNGT